MKRILIVGTLLLLVSILSGCGPKQEVAQQPEKSNKGQESDQHKSDEGYRKPPGSEADLNMQKK